ncbi:MAG: class I SAM-dependent methyltransferase [Alphaproteobacteria bacterium]|nr:class I SAM-dependent methyltransferase [Alphaproteobacteria bacterium]
MTQATHSGPKVALDADAVRSAYRKQASFYDYTFGAVSWPGRRGAVALVNRLAGTRVLEVGVGTGLALPLYKPEKRVVGIDLSPEMLVKARERVEAEKLAHVEALLEMDAEQMAFPDASFDISVAMYTASVVPHADRLLAEMRRVTKPGGDILFINHFVAEGGVRRWIEDRMASLSRKLGWHPDFAMEGFLDRKAIEFVSVTPMRPLGIFTLVHLRNVTPGQAPAA